MIEPSNGRIVWYRPGPADNQLSAYGLKPWAAMVTHVWDDRKVNLMVFPPDGSAHTQVRVMLLQDDDAKPDGYRFAQWMPYQKGQAQALDKAALNDIATATANARQNVAPTTDNIVEAVKRLLLPLQTLADFAVKAMAESDDERAQYKANVHEAGLA